MRSMGLGKSPRVDWPDFVGRPAIDPARGTPYTPFRPPRIPPDHIIHTNDRYGSLTLRGVFQRAVAHLLDCGAHSERGAYGRWVRRREGDGLERGLVGATQGMVFVWRDRAGGNI